MPRGVSPVYLEIINAKTQTLDTLLEDLIQTSMFSSRRVEYKFYEINAGEYLDSLINETRVRVENEGLRFASKNDVPEATLFVIDRSRIDQVVSNIIGNALKFTPQGGEVSFLCNVEESAAGDGDGTDGRLMIRIKDNGAGIPDEDLTNIFRRRYSGLSQPDGAGYGLGLYISREIIEQHDGQIWAENNPEKGASLCFYLPCYQSKAAAID
jgi:signal transduction histidine kinase